MGNCKSTRSSKLCALNQSFHAPRLKTIEDNSSSYHIRQLTFEIKQKSSPNLIQHDTNDIIDKITNDYEMTFEKFQKEILDDKFVNISNENLMNCGDNQIYHRFTVQIKYDSGNPYIIMEVFRIILNIIELLLQEAVYFFLRIIEFDQIVPILPLSQNNSNLCYNQDDDFYKELENDTYKDEDEEEEGGGNNEPKINLRDVRKGLYDDFMIAIFRLHIVDRQRTFSGATGNNKESAIRRVIQKMGGDPNDDEITDEIYRILMYNKRRIRDRIYDPLPRLEYRLQSNATGGILQRKEMVRIPYGDVRPKVKPPFMGKGDSKSSQKSELKSKTPDKTKQKEGPVVKHPRINETPVQMPNINSRKAVIASCPRCKYTGTTIVQFKIGPVTWATAAGMAMTGVFLPFCWMPVVVSGTKDALHICSNCRYIMGLVPRAPCSKAKNIQEEQVKVPEKFNEEKVKGKFLLSMEKEMQQKEAAELSIQQSESKELNENVLKQKISRQSIRNSQRISVQQLSATIKQNPRNKQRSFNQL